MKCIYIRAAAAAAAAAPLVLRLIALDGNKPLGYRVWYETTPAKECCGPAAHTNKPTGQSSSSQKNPKLPPAAAAAALRKKGRKKVPFLTVS